MMDLLISEDQKLLDIALIHDYLSNHSYWAKGISLARVSTSIEHSLCFGVYLQQANKSLDQIGFARVVTDYATFGNLVDVFILPAYQGRGVSRSLLEVIMAHESLSGLRRFTLATSDAHGLYKKFGFSSLSKPETLMEIYQPGLYQQEP